MRTIFLLLILAVLFNSLAFSREIGAGLTLGYRTEKPTTGFGGTIYYRYNVPENFLNVKGFAGLLSVGYFNFPKEDRSAEYSFIPVKYGLSYTAYSVDNVRLGVIGDAGLAFLSKPKSETKLAGGIGAFVMYCVNPDVKVVGTIKYSAILKTIHHLGIEAGIFYKLPPLK